MKKITNILKAIWKKISGEVITPEEARRRGLTTLNSN